MSTYLPGVPNYIPQVQEFKPDFNFYAKSLQMSQSKYDANHEKLSNLYGSLLNSPMLREKNIEARDQFFKAIDQDIKKISGMDLSKQQNVDSASTVFNQLIDNKQIVKDMTWTRNLQNEHKRADAFRSCVDPAKCGGAWWEGGVQALGYMAEEFKNASDEEAMQFGNARFTPYQDVTGKAIKLAKEADLNVTVDSRTGGFIVTTKNGPNLLAKPLFSLFANTLGKDPAIMDYYKTKAYVDRNGWVQGKTPEYGNKEAAEQAYIQLMTQELKPKLAQDKDDLSFSKDNLSQERRNIEEKIRRDGTTPDSPLAALLRRVNGTSVEVDGSLEVVTEAEGNLDVASSNKINKATLANLDSALAAGYLKKDIGQAAMTLSYRNASQTMKVDPYAMENVRQSNRLLLEDVRFKNRTKLESMKYNLKQFGNMSGAMGEAIDNIPLLRDAMGGIDISDDPQAAYKQITKEIEDLKSSISAPEKKILLSAMRLTQERSKTSNGLANEDLVKVMDAVMEKFADPTNYKDGPADQASIAYAAQNNPKLAAYRKMTNEQKLQFARSYDFGKLESLNGTIIDDIYNENILPMLDQTKEANRAARGYLSNLWTNSKPERDAIYSKNLNLDKMNGYFSTQTQKVKQDLKTDPAFKDYAGVIDMLIDDHGRMKSDVDFAREYAANAVKNVPAANKKQVAVQAYQQGLATYNALESGEYRNAGITNTEAVTKLFGTGTVQPYDVFKEAWSKYATVEGAPGYLKGAGSQAVEKQMVFPAVDPARFQSVGTSSVKSFMKDIWTSGGDATRIQLGGLDPEIPVASNPEAIAALKQIFTDINTRTNPKDMKRPILQASYQDIAGNNAGWSALNIKMTDQYLSQYIGTKENPGVLWGMRKDLQTKGISMYLKKDKAENLFRKNATNTNVDTILGWTGSYDMVDYPNETRDLKLTTKPSGGYALQGSVKTGINKETGEPIWYPIGNDYPQQNPNKIVNDFNNELKNILEANKYLIDNYNLAHGIKDPQQLQ